MPGQPWTRNFAALGFSLHFLLFAAPNCAAGAPLSRSQVALYQGAEREKNLIEGAKREGQQLIMTGGLWSPREDGGSVDQKFKKSYLDAKYSGEEMETKLTQWETLLHRLFFRQC